MSTPQNNVISINKANKRKKNNLIMLHWIGALLRSDELTRSEKLVCAVLFTHFSCNDFSCFPSRETIAQKMGYSVRVATNAYWSASKKGWLVIKKRRTPTGNKNFYYIQMPKKYWSNEEDFNRHQQYLIALGVIGRDIR